ncbi:hypothetical protein CcaverHIS002_0507330 [Cutaneotrichosporon cavernicola]|uniref:L-lactate dehydrogenase (cytochrome) n=1 Tax=Cutaneotrichosporon cavernicola TaxID=279322 RepID=A0AA48L748_9TREE|nr:uncharacterized protein CcaverHIS019_0507880 [Cutaneotrichosporon cavernicola]BEI85332.1 hypothetical protein CcaverHIS002_0507330 [Cutaneotrichosporon cavernicola]BEI93160.1 hypothetical protein CcaverHIS019_0507880 [Cutaneotrichosporon cavernicola]BEJ00937.1 hypothetical protein CcaverHIS631_0507940 [Cutaneotrichosporon cavernicola]BEJ08702.1 hypothetical protein CcaverHIS641_0507960 [Cutaneotrichosporon cavernicola]
MSLRTATRILSPRCAAARLVQPARRLASTSGSSSSSSSHGQWGRYSWRAAALVGVTALTLYSTTSTANADAPKPNGKFISYEEVQKHNRRDDCWVIIAGNVYDVTDFIAVHPGGAAVILHAAGRDATKVFVPLHPPDSLQILPKSKHLGPVDPATLPEEDDEPTEEEERIAEARAELPPAESMLLLNDFEEWAERVLTATGWNYYRSAADSEATFDNNAAAFNRYFFRPRILRDITEGNLETEVLGQKTAMPVFISPAAMAKLGHPLGEVNLTRGAGNAGIVQGISINASCSLDEIMAARQAGQNVWFQIYLNRDRAASERLLEKVTALGANAIIFTVDVAWQSKRTRDVRGKAAVAAPIETTDAGKGDRGGAGKQGAGVSSAISGYQDPHLVWSDIEFIRRNTTLPIIVKGVQSIEDVAACAEAGVQGVILSNHGGRSADYAPAPIDLLYELRALRPDLFDKVDIMMDGGVRSGADVVKALALGAKAVGLGRPFLYANSTHGQEGVERVCEILDEEITNTMRNCGVSRVADLKPEMVGPAGPWVGANRPPWL